MISYYLKTFNCIILSLCIFLLVPVAASASQRPEPVKGLMEMFETFNNLEEEFRENKWEEAEEIVSEIESDYKALVNDLKGNVDSKLVHKFGFLIGSFKKQLAKKDLEILEKPYMNIQDLFMDIMGYFDYPNPPVFIIIKMYLEESGEYLEDGKYQHIKEEMEEIAHFRERAIKDAKTAGKDLKTVEELFELTEKIEEMTEKKDRKGLEKAIANVSSIIKGLIT